jgi:hypothetical protein
MTMENTTLVANEGHSLPGRKKLYPGNTLGKIVPGKNSVPGLKNGGKKFWSLKVWKG